MPALSKLAAAAAAVVLLGGACTGDGDDDETTPRPTQPERVEVVSDFQLVGEIDEAFAGAEPDVDVPDDDIESSQADDEDVTGPTLAPDETPFGSTPAEGGIMRITIEDASDALTSECGVAAEEDVDVYWTTDTSFDPDDVLDDIEAKIEDNIEGRVAGVSGRILRPEDGDGTDTPRPTDDCVLVADQVGFTSSTLPTPSGTVRRPTTPTRTSEPDDTAEPSSTPKKTDKPDDSSPDPDRTDEPRATATSTAEEGSR